MSEDITDLRKTKYRSLLDEIENIYGNEEENPADTKLIDNILNEVDNLLHERTTDGNLGHTDEFVLDATLIEKANNILYKFTHSIVPVIDTYNPSEFAAKLRAKFLCSSETYQNEKLEWANLFEISRKTLRVTPTFSYMCGYDVTKTASENRKERKIRDRKENKNEQVTTKQPEKIADLRREEDSVDDTVKFILWALNKEYKNNNSKPINYFKFTMEPESYSQSVENCFHLSFLIRDGRVHFIKDESGMLVISPVSHKHSRAEINLPFQQYIVSLDTSLWKKAILLFNIQTNTLHNWRLQWEEKKKQK